MFRAELDSLDNDAYTSYVDALLDSANALGSYCGCGAVNVSFSRQNLLYPVNGCTADSTAYWQWTEDRDGGECVARFVNGTFDELLLQIALISQ